MSNLSPKKHGLLRNLTIIERPESASVRAMHSYWASKRGDRRAPSRSDIDPIEIKSHLSTLFMLDVVEEGRDYRYRLIGTDIVEASGRDVTGARFSDLYTTQPEALALVLQTFAPVVSEGRPVFAVGRMFWRPDRDFRHFEGGYFPLSTDGTSVDLMLCKMCFLDQHRSDDREATQVSRSP